MRNHFLRAGLIDQTGFNIHPVLLGSGIPLFHEMSQGKADAAVRVEHLWDEIAKNCNVDILCGYVLNSFHREQESHIYERICAEYSAVSSW